MLNPYALNNGIDKYLNADFDKNYVTTPLIDSNHLPALAFDGFIQFKNGKNVVNIETSQDDQEFYENQIKLFNNEPKQYTGLKVLIEKK